MDELSRKHVRASTRHMISWLNHQGVYPAFGAELEYWLFKNGQKVQRDSYEIRNYQQRVGELARQQGINIAMQTFDAGVGQYELATAVSDPATAGEWSLKLKQIFKQVAQEQGLEVNLKPKPSQDLYGSGFHVHMGLYNRDITGVQQSVDNYSRRVNVSPPPNQNLLLDSYGQRNGFASKIVEGLSEVMEESQIIYFPTYNALKRNFGAQGSTYASKLLQASTTKGQYAIRIIDNGGATRYEARLAGMDADPDLTMCSLVAGIVRGVERAKGIAYTSPFKNEQDFEVTHPPIVAPNGDPAPQNGAVPSSIPLAGGLQVYADDVPAKDFMSYAFMTADSLPRLMGRATHKRLCGGLATNSSFFISPVNLQEYNLLGELRSTTSWDTINKVLKANERQIAHKFVRVLGDKQANALVFSFRDEEERNRFVKQEMGPYLVEAMSLKGVTFHGSIDGESNYTAGKKPDAQAGEQPCLIFDASKMAGFIEAYGKSHKSNTLRTELERYESRRQTYTNWVPIQYDAVTPAQQRQAKLIVDLAAAELEQERTRAAEREARQQRDREATQAIPRREELPPVVEPLPQFEEEPLDANAQTLVAQAVRHRNWVQDSNGNYRINRSELNLRGLGRMQNSGMVLTDNYVFVLSGSNLHRDINTAIRERLAQERSTQQQLQGQIFEAFPTHQQWELTQQGYYTQSSHFPAALRNLNIPEFGITSNAQYTYVARDTDLFNRISLLREQRAAEQGRVDPSTLNELYQQLSALPSWERDTQGRYYRPTQEFNAEQLGIMRRVNGDVVVTDNYVFVNQNTNLDRAISEGWRSRIESLAQNINTILPRAAQEVQWQRDSQTNSWFVLATNIPEDIRQTLLADGNNIVPQDDGRIFVSQGSRLDELLNGRGNGPNGAGNGGGGNNPPAPPSQSLPPLDGNPVIAAGQTVARNAGFGKMIEYAAASIAWEDYSGGYSVSQNNLTGDQKKVIEGLLVRNREKIKVDQGYYDIPADSSLTKAIREVRQNVVETKKQQTINRGREIAHTAGFDSTIKYAAATMQWEDYNSGVSVKQDGLSADHKAVIAALRAETPDLFTESQGYFDTGPNSPLTQAVKQHRGAGVELSRQQIINKGREIARSASFENMLKYAAASMQWEEYNSGVSVRQDGLSPDHKAVIAALRAENPDLFTESQGYFDTGPNSPLTQAVKQHRNAGTELSRQQVINKGREIAIGAGFDSMLKYVAASLQWEDYNNGYSVRQDGLSPDHKAVIAALRTETPDIFVENQGYFDTPSNSSLTQEIRQHRNAGTELSRQQVINRGREIARAAGFEDTVAYLASLQGWENYNNGYSIRSERLSGDQREVLKIILQQNSQAATESGEWIDVSNTSPLKQAIDRYRDNPNAGRVHGNPEIERGRGHDAQERQ